MGALVNGVFLVALCLSIALDAIQRFFEPQIVSDPKLVFAVGCAGLVSNFIGLFLFHEHGHSHGGGHSHSHSGTNKLASAEEGHSHGVSPDLDSRTREVVDEGGNVANVLPQSAVGGWQRSVQVTSPASEEVLENKKGAPWQFTKSDEDSSTAANSASLISTKKSAMNGPRAHRRYPSSSRSAFSSVDDIQIHPASFRNDIIAAGRLEDIGSEHDTDSVEEAIIDGQETTEDSPLLGKSRSRDSRKYTDSTTKSYRRKSGQGHDSLHEEHHHNQKQESDKSGHSHADLNMRGVFLHVMGDALGNIGVIGSALIIWLTSYSWRFYVDPAVSLVITVIILGSAIPLCKAASRILLQAAPESINMKHIIRDIQKLPGIISCHHLHVWQLNDTKIVASLHIQVEYDIKGEGSARYMELAREVNQCLHAYGIHNSTIQPEFCLDSKHQHISNPSLDDNDQGSKDVSAVGGNKVISSNGSRVGSMRSGLDGCLLECSNECDERQCCVANFTETEPETETYEETSHSHQ